MDSLDVKCTDITCNNSLFTRPWKIKITKNWHHWRRRGSFQGISQNTPRFRWLFSMHESCVWFHLPPVLFLGGFCIFLCPICAINWNATSFFFIISFSASKLALSCNRITHMRGFDQRIWIHFLRKMRQF